MLLIQVVQAIAISIHSAIGSSGRPGQKLVKMDIKVDGKNYPNLHGVQSLEDIRVVSPCFVLMDLVLQ